MTLKKLILTGFITLGIWACTGPSTNTTNRPEDTENNTLSTSVASDSDTDAGTTGDEGAPDSDGPTDSDTGIDSAVDDSDTASADTEVPPDTLSTDSLDTDSLDTDSLDTETVVHETDSASETESPQEPQSWCVAEGMTAHTSVDLLLVVDNSNSMYQEQQILATALYTLTNALVAPVDGSDPIDDVRIAITTTDMGVSYDGQAYDDKDNRFDNNQVKCSGLGDNGAFVSHYVDDYRVEDMHISEGVIACNDSGAQCPDGWECVLPAPGELGSCFDPDGNGSDIECPDELEGLNESFIHDYSPSLMGLFAACHVAAIGTDGCNYEQQLAAAAAGLTYGQETFVRADSLTAIVIVSDEDDCSIKSSQWHELPELSDVTANTACGRHPEFLFDIEELKERYVAAKVAEGGTEDDVVFAAIAGVPMVDACQGTGDAISGCVDVQPLVNGTGTMAVPEVVTRTTSSGVDQRYFEYACKRYAEGADTEVDSPLTAAYPGTRYIEMAQAFGERGYLYSICNDDWSLAMTNIATVVRSNVKIVCLE